MGLKLVTNYFLNMNTKKYIKKPIPVSALQWTGENLDEFKSFCDANKIPYAITKDLFLLTVGSKTIGKYKNGDKLLDVSVNDYIVTTEEVHIEVLSSKDFDNLYTEIEE